MPLEPPQLDDRQFEDLLAEAKLRLQRYCPEWTDFNDSDPGMALVQLFAWLTELMLYRINQIPERNYISFLKLLKLERHEARPSKTQVVMTMATSPNKPDAKAVRVRSKFFVTADSGDSLTFETIEPIDLVPYPLDVVQVFDGLQYEDHSKPNATGTQSFRPLGWTPQTGNILYLGFHPDQSAFADPNNITDAVFPEKLVLFFFFPTGRQTVVQSRQSKASTGSGQVPPTLVWEYQSRFDRASGDPLFDADRWRPLTVLEDATLSLTREGRVVVRGPGADCLPTQSPKPADEERRFWIRCRLVGGNYAKEDIPEIAFVRCNAVEVENRSTFQNEVVGIGDGTQVQFQFQNRPIDAKSIDLILVSDNGLEEQCTLKDDLFASTISDLHFTLNPNSGEIHFGDGKNGRIPGAGQSLIAKSYRAGGGADGNIRAGTIQDPPLGVSGLESVTNPRQAQGGMDEESLSDLLKRAPRVLRGDARAVTKDDYRRFAEEIPGVGRAIVRPQVLPEHPGLSIPGAITVVVIPKAPVRDATDQFKPARFVPPAELLQAVFERLEEIKPAGTEVVVVAPRLHELNLAVVVTPAQGVSENQAKDQVKKALEHYFQPVEDTRIQPAVDPLTHQRRRSPSPRWEVETPIYPSRLYEALFAARDSESDKPLVQDVVELTLKDAGKEIELGKALELDKDELPYVIVTVEVPPDNGRRRT